MPRKIGIDSDGVRSTALRGTDAPDDATRADCPPEAQAGGDIPPPDMEIKAMEREDEPEMTGPPIGRFEMHLIRPPMLFGCERMPFLVLLGGVAFLVVAVFGITPWGLIGGGLMLAGGLIWLRDIARDDPQWFAMRLERMKYPTHMPDILPDPRLTDWDFVGFDDPPAPEEVAKAWAGVAAAALVPSATVTVFFGIGAGAGSFVALMAAVALWAFWEDLQRFPVAWKFGWLRARSRPTRQGLVKTSAREGRR